MAEANINEKELDLVTTTMSNKSVAQAGCNSFGLVTIEDDGNGNPVPVMCTGLLTELPSFSISPTYDLSPGKTVLDLYTDVFKKDEFDVAAVLMAASNSNYNNNAFEWQNVMQAGPMTRGMFKSVSYGDFSLKFKIYEQNTFGQSRIDEWKALLSKLATPSITAASSAKALLDNIQGALTILGDNGDAIVRELNKGRRHASTPNSVTKKIRLIDYKRHKSAELLEKFCNILNSSRTPDATSEISIEFDGFFETKITPGQAFKVYVPKFKVVKNGTATVSFINMTGLVWKEPALVNVSKLEGIIWSSRDDAYWFKCPNIGRSEPLEDFNESTFYGNVLNSQNKAEKFKDIFINFLGIKNFYDVLIEGKNTEQKAKYSVMELDLKNTVDTNTTRFRLEQTVNELWNLLQATEIPEAPTSFINRLAEHTENTLKNVNQFITSTGFLNNYGENRVYEDLNRHTRLGEKLWHLYIYYPWFFKKPITVCITDWSFTPSKQLQKDGKPAYHEIEIKCKMDQIPSRETWNKLFSDICYVSAELKED